MINNAELRYIPWGQIDRKKWNRCIDAALNCRIYAYDWHLDRSSINWDALVWGDYEYVMPLPVRKKIGITYLYQPLYSQQLGIFPSPPHHVSEAFFQLLTSRFRYFDLQLNSENTKPGPIDKLEYLPKKNYLLYLNQDSEKLRAAYSKNTVRNINKANNNKLNLIEGIRLQEYIEFKREITKIQLKDEIIDRLKSIISYGIYKGIGKIYGVYGPTNELSAAVYFCHWRNRVIYFNAASSEQGKELRAMYFLVNKFIEDNTGKDLMLDFEGSMIPGVARFYSGFGAKPETYLHLKYNRLPLPLRWFKK